MQRPVPASLPVTPGVYLYKDAQGTIIYVGKARNLRKRILSYFRDASALSPKTVAMIGHAASLETLSTGTEKEALLLEASLIKRHRPHYNIVLRDDKQYVLFRIDRKVPYPRLEVVRLTKSGKIARDRALYFGPFTSGLAARETWRSIHRAFPLRRCTDRAFHNRVRPCLYHHIGQCLAPCTENVPQQTYQALVQRVELLLSGRSRDLLEQLRQAMFEASDQLDFERAAVLRDQIRAVEQTVEKQSVVLPEGGDMDICGVTPARGGLGIGLLCVREGRLMDGRTFFWPGLELADAEECLWTFLPQYYSAPGGVPPRVVVPWLPTAAEYAEEDPSDSVPRPVEADGADKAGGSDAENGRDTPSSPQPSHPLAEQTGDDDAERGAPLPEPAEACQAPPDAAALRALEAALADARGGPVRITLPRGAAEARLVDMAAANAREAALNQREQPMSERLAAVFRSAHPIRRVECVDVSHTGGESTRIGMVVFEDGDPLKSAYRVYALRPEDGVRAQGDDYAALAAWMRRRLRAGPPWADLVLIDGGRGQVAVAHRAMRDTLDAEGPADKPAPFLLAGIAKARDEGGRADRRAGNTRDRIFLPGRSNPLPLREGSAELLFLQHVRDTAHRHAIGRHRQARAKAALAGELRRIPGVGPATERLLWAHFSRLEAMLAATPEDLAAIPGIGVRKAELLAARLAALRDETPSERGPDAARKASKG